MLGAETLSVPPSAIASRALMAMLSSADSSCTGSARQVGCAGDVELDPDPLVERAAQHVGQRAEHRGDVDRRRLQHLAAREREQLAGQLGAAPRRPQCRGDGDELRAAGLVAGQRRQVLEHLQVALDHRQQVVEVVGDAAGELADALEPLRMAERLFRLRRAAGWSRAGWTRDSRKRTSSAPSG